MSGSVLFLVKGRCAVTRGRGFGPGSRGRPNLQGTGFLKAKRALCARVYQYIVTYHVIG